MRFLKRILGVVGVMWLTTGATQAQPPSIVDSLRILPGNFSIPNPAVSTNFKVAVFLKNATTLGGVSVPVTFPGHAQLRIDTTVLSSEGNKGVSYGPSGQTSAGWTIRTSLVENVNRRILVGFISFSQFPPNNDTLAYLHFDYDASAVSAQVRLDTGVVNNQHLTVTDILATDLIPRWTPGTITIGTPQPAIGLSPTSMIFNGVIGTANPPPQALTIANTGVGTLSWTVATTQTWLSVNPSSGSGNGNPNVSVNIAGLAAGTQTGWVIVSDPAASNTPESLFVSLNLTKPTLAAAPPSLTFSGVAGGTDPASQNVLLSASQAAAISWTGSKSSAWLTINPAAGTTPNSIGASVDISGLAAGVYRDTIVITSANGANSPFKIPVLLNLASPPQIALNPTTLNFTAVQGGAHPDPDTVLLTNPAGTAMDYEVTWDQTWLNVTPTAGSAPALLQVSANTTGILAGTFTGHIVVTSTVAVNSPETVTVTLTVQSAPPVLSVNPTSASFNATEGDLVGNPLFTKVVINNAGSGTLNWSIAGKDSAWVVLSKLTGGGPDTLEVSVNPAGKVAGHYQEVFQISDPAATGSPVSFTVDLDVLAGPPTLALAPASFTFTAVVGGADPALQALSITNVGGSQTLAWTATFGQPWLSLSSSAGTAPSQVDLHVDAAGLGVGTYFDTVNVSSGAATNSPQRVPVTLNVIPPPPQIAVDPDSLTFVATLGDPNPTPQSLTITNTGGGTLNWVLTLAGGFLATSDSSGIAPTTVDVFVDLSGLLPGTHVGTLQINGAGASNTPVHVPVVLILNDLPPVLEVTPASLVFQAQEGGGNPPIQSFQVANTGGSVLLWNATSTAPWISNLDPSSGSNQDDVFVYVDIAGLSAATYVDSVLVNAGTVAGSPQYVRVTLELAPPPPPEIALQPTSFVFNALFGGGNPASKALNISNGGGRQLEWTAVHGEDWLSLSETSGTAPSVSMLEVDISGLSVGTYYDTVVVSSDSATNSPQRASVVLNVVQNPPVIVLSPTTYYFEIVKGSPDPPCKPLQITNGGAGDLNWTAAKKAAWLALSSSAGTAPSTVDLCVAGAGLVPGTYRDTVVVQSGDALNSPQKAIVTFVVKQVAKPAIVLQPDSLYFMVNAGPNSDTQCTYVFINGNGGRLVWRTHTDAAWIELSPDSCNISLPLCITVDASGLAAGTYCDSVEVSGDASNSPQYLTVCMDVVSAGEEPILAVSPTHIETTVPQGSGLQVQQMTISNIGSGTLSWSINTGQLVPWLSVSSSSGSAPGVTEVRLQPLGLLPGVYADTLVVASAQAGNSPIGVPVVLTVTGGAVEADSVRVGTDSAAPGQIVMIPVYFDNSQPLFGVSVPLTWSGTGVWADSVTFVGSRGSDADLLVASVDTSLREIRIALASMAIDPTPVGSGLLARVYFTVSPQAPNQTVEIDTATTSAPAISLAYVDTTTSEYVPGFRVGRIVVAGAQPPVLSVQPDSLHFTGTAGGANPPSQHVVVSNAGGSLLTFVASESVPWLTINPLSGAQGDSVFFSVQLAGLSQDQYSGTVRFVSPEAQDTVNVKVALEVGAQVNPPALALSPGVLNFTTLAGTLPASQTLTVLNTGGGSLSWAATKTQTWFSISPNTGGAGQTVTVNITSTSLAVGTYKDTITFSDPGASNSPRKAAVNLVVTGPAKPDTVRVAHVTAAPGDTVQVAVSVKNTFEVVGMVLPFKYSGTGVTLLPAEVTSRSGPGVFAIFTNNAGNSVPNTGLYGFISFGAGMPPGDGDVLLLKFAIAPDAPAQVITIDTTTLPPANRLVLNDPTAMDIFPEFLAGSVTVTTGDASTIWITDAAGEAGDRVEVVVHAHNALPVDHLVLPLRLTSQDVSIVSADFAGTRSETGIPHFTVTDDQHFTLNVDWTGNPLSSGTGVLARLVLQLKAGALPQMAYVDTAGEYGFRLGGGSQAVDVPAFTRGSVRLDVGSAAGEDPTLPLAFGLDPNYPNPFNPSTNISYTLSAAGRVRLDVYNTLGRHVITLVEDYRSAGAHTVTWDGRDAKGQGAPSGVYLYRLESGVETALRKMTLMK